MISLISQKLVVLVVHSKIFYHFILFHLKAMLFVSYSRYSSIPILRLIWKLSPDAPVVATDSNRLSKKTRGKCPITISNGNIII